MIKLKILQLALVLTLACICATLSGAGPNEAKTELKFETKSNQQARMLLRSRYAPPYGATHYAVLFVRGNWRSYRNFAPIESILETSVGLTMSQKQRDVISNQSIKWRDNGATISKYTYYQLFGISEDDTKKMVKAFIEILENEANKEKQSVLNEQQERKEKISEIKKELPEKQKKFEETKSKYKEIKNARYFSLTDSQIYTKAKELMLEMDKMLDTLEIELAGIKSKLKEIESYRRSKRLSGKDLSYETVDKLDQMFVEQLVELRGVEARKKAALRIRDREKEFLVVFNQWRNLESEVNELKGQLGDQEHNLRQAETKLANPTPEMLPPKIYQNKVTIYPIDKVIR